MSIRLVEDEKHGLPDEDALYGIFTMLSSFEHLREDASPAQLAACVWLQNKMESESHWQALIRLQPRLEELQGQWKALGGSEKELSAKLHELSQQAAR